MIRVALFLAIVGGSAVASSAYADGPRTDSRAQAQQLFDSALADAEAGNFALACPKFLASQEVDPKTSTLLNLGSCYDKNGQSASAWGAFREAEGLARKAGRADWEASARARAEALEPKLLRVAVQVEPASRVPSLLVTRDGARVGPGEWGVPIPVDPGEHVIRATADGRRPWESRITVSEPTFTLTVPILDLIPEPPAPPPPSVVETPRPVLRFTPLRTAGAVTAGVGVVGLVTGGIFALVAKGAYDDARDRCTGGTNSCPASAVADADGAYGTAGAATVIFVGGAALLAGGAALYFLAPDAKSTRGFHLGPRGVAATW